MGQVQTKEKANCLGQMEKVEFAELAKKDYRNQEEVEEEFQKAKEEGYYLLN